MQQKTLIYEFPIRVFHWLLVFVFAIAYGIALFVSEDRGFAYHMLYGLMLVPLILFRLFVGVFGEEHSRFANLDLRLSSLVEYFKSVGRKEKTSHRGHNPASSWLAILILLITAFLATSGILMTWGGLKPEFEDIHQIVAHAFAVLAALHFVGVFLHHFQHRDRMATAMIDGQKLIDAPSANSVSKRPILGWAFLIFFFLGFAFLLKQYDAQSGVLQIFNQEIQLVELSESEIENSGE